MGKIRQINIKNRTYYFYKDQINLKDFDASMLKIYKKNYNEIHIYYIGYATFKRIANCNNINSVNPLYLMMNKMISHFQRNIKKFGMELKKKLKQLMVAKKIEYGKDLKKMRFRSDDDMSLNKTIKLLLLTIIIRCVFSGDGRFYPQLFLPDTLFDV